MSLADLGQTRSSRKQDHLLQTPGSFIRTVLPGMHKCVAVVHSGPAIGAAFAQYTAEMQLGGILGNTTAQRFLYLLEGQVAVGETALDPGSYAYLPQGDHRAVEARRGSRLLVIEKNYVRANEASAPAFFVGCEHEVEPKALEGDTGILVRTLIPDDMAHDFAVNTMTYEPGASLSMVEIHIMEHGLLVLEGGGIYRLGECWYPVTAGDFIWMAPYCPQWFGALGKASAKYIIYKDWNRHPL